MILCPFICHVESQTKKQTNKKQISRSEESHFGGSSGGEMQHFMQFSVATREPCTLHCVMLDCNDTK